ncbi:hypothetical protein DAPPUDRAFT_238258 [Daphnia pulex]|uniref:Uncharacterized protein n=1 Tax=Daphnia pulex TaxID=6669 RepID=E9G5Y5_DAPPU|nr:hypothetical protein DAPPUDRAFT_238258 [Daphnia pulex]|eukprot:EFX84845.1 hypothetical protein DAPPUDRAFT_238258 [Daphnia pulex]
MIPLQSSSSEVAHWTECQDCSSTHPQQRQPANKEKDSHTRRPNPSNVNLQNEMPVCMSFTLEGHGDLYVKRVMQWCRGWVRTDVLHHYQTEKRRRKISRVSISDTATTAAHSPSAFFPVLPVRNHGQQWRRAPVGCCIVDGSTTGVPMSPGVWRMPNRNAAALLHNNIIATTGYYTTKYNSALSYITTEPEYYTEVPKYYISKAPEYYTTLYAAPAYYTDAPVYYNTEELKYYATTYAAPSYYTYVPNQRWRRAPVGCCIVDGWVDHWCTDVSEMSPWYGANQTATPPPSYTTYATTSSCTEVFKYYITTAPVFYTTTYAAPSHYTDALKY